MARGPKPQPVAVKAQKVAVRSKRDAKAGAPAVAVAAVPLIKAPDWLKPEGRKIWDRLAPTLGQAKLLTQADSMAFGRYCRNFADWLKLRAEMDKKGAVYETESEHMKGKLLRANPAFLIADRLERQLMAMEDRFGMNPAERQRIMAARSASGVSGDLFAADAKAEPRKNDPAAKPAQVQQPAARPVGFLN